MWIRWGIYKLADTQVGHPGMAKFIPGCPGVPRNGQLLCTDALSDVASGAKCTSYTGITFNMHSAWHLTLYHTPCIWTDFNYIWDKTKHICYVQSNTDKSEVRSAMDYEKRRETTGLHLFD